MNKFKYSESDNKLLLDILKPIPCPQNPPCLHCSKQLDEWNSRLSYSLSKELRDKLIDGEVCELGKDFELKKVFLARGSHYQIEGSNKIIRAEKDENGFYFYSIAIPLPEQTSAVQDWKDSELAKVTDRMKADLDRLAYLEERVKTLEKYETAALKLAAFNWKELQTPKVKEPERLDELKCVPGCKHYTGGEIRHHKTCPFYPDSLSIKYDELDRKASQEWFTIQDVLLAFDAGNKRGAYPISIGHNPHPNKEDYVKQTFGIDIKNNQPSNT